MKVLLVGAGAVGQAYGRHFQRGGAQVSFLVRARYAEALRAGVDLYPLNERSPRHGPVRFSGFGVLTDLDAVAQTAWDCVVLSISSTALQRGTFLDELVAAIGAATVVSLTPGIEDGVFLRARVPEERLVLGLIGLTSYPGPLPGEVLPAPGMVYWLPPLAAMGFSGPPARTQAVVKTLRAGGMRSRRVRDVQVDAAFAGPLLGMLVVALELSAWSAAALRRDRPLLRTTAESISQALRVGETLVGCRSPWALRQLGPGLLGLLLRVAPWVVPFDLERFLEMHFTKVGDQTEDTLRRYLKLAAAEGLPCAAIDALHGRLVALRARGDAPTR